MQSQESQAAVPQNLSMDCRLVYVIVPSHEDASHLGRTVVGARLAACANILGPVDSLYWWEGRLEEGHEVALLLKTRANLVDQIVATVQAHHRDACPCVIAIPIVAGNVAFLEWIVAETRTCSGPCSSTTNQKGSSS